MRAYYSFDEKFHPPKSSLSNRGAWLRCLGTLQSTIRGVSLCCQAIVGRGHGLREGIVKLRDLKEHAGGLAIPNASPSRRFEHVLNLRAMLTAAEAVLRSALAREESRGAHHREDFPEEADGRQKNILCAGDEGGDMHLWTEPVSEVPAEIRKALDENYSLDYHYLE